MQKIDKEFVESLKRENVLSLDVATHCGYYSIFGSGTWYFPTTEKATKKMGADYQQHTAFRNCIERFIEAHNIKVVAAEDVIYEHYMDFRKLCEFRGILFELCESLDIPIVTFKPADIKKWATGKGSADKSLMIEFCKKRWHIEPVDDNEADAAHIFFYFCKRYNI